MAVLAITFSDGIGIVLFLLTLGLKAQKHLARGERQRRPELIASNNFSPCKGKGVTSLFTCGMRFS